MPNIYATLNEIKRALLVTDTDSDAHLMEALEEASRAIDVRCRRHFYSVTATRIFDGSSNIVLQLPHDLLSISELATDDDGDRVYDDAIWVSGDYALLPLNGWPKCAIRLSPDGDYAWPAGRESISISGVWGYGDGESADPWLATSATGTIATTTGTTMTASASGVIEAGHTIRVESEQMFVSAVSGASLTVRRGMNGTTAAAHSAKTISIAQYPATIRRACRYLAGEIFKTSDRPGITSETMGDYSYTRAIQASAANNPQIMLNLMAGLIKL